MRDADRQRARWRQARARYRARHPERCSRCARARDLPGKWCALCLAETLEKRLPDHAHDTVEHAAMLLRARDPASACELSGATGEQLARINEHLEVDRRNPWLGYVAGNMQLLAGTLNRRKARGLEPPAWAVAWVRELCHEVRGEF